MQNGSRKMEDKRYQDLYKKHDPYALKKAQGSGAVCKEYPADRKAEGVKHKPYSNAKI